jgi:hypothetical protein
MDLWINQWRKRQTSGDVIVVRYADDAVLGFQRKDDAEAFLSQLHPRLDCFGLSLNEDKTKLIRFGRSARKDGATAGRPKPESFDFLGFTHSCAVLRDRRTFMLLRQTSVSRTRRTLHSVKDGWKALDEGVTAPQPALPSRVGALRSVLARRSATTQSCASLAKQTI